MNDRELLELAAKAAGLSVIHDAGERGIWVAGLEDEWNPLTDDGDALRLAVMCDVDFYFAEDDVMNAYAGYHTGPNSPMRYCIEPLGTDPCAATRRAIVRAAAEIGKAMK